MLGVTGPTGPVSFLVSVEAWGSLLFSLLGSIIYSTGVAKLVWGRPLGSHYAASHGMAIFAYHDGFSWRG